uniref:tryptophan--tRNA ligase n=1 Tax=Panagrolaimus superbus TaxID=310955 RepID=A0A914YSF6_9BILA
MSPCPAMQGVPSFSSNFPQIFGISENIPCLIPCAIDQDPFFEITRKIAPKISFEKPNLIYSGFLPSLQGAQNKMSGSDSESCIRLSDSPKEIQQKILNSFDGGKDGDKMMNCDMIVAYQFLHCFEEKDCLIKEIKEVRVFC